MGEAMRWADEFIAVDWGTTNRRAYLIDCSGSCAREFEDNKGILSVPPAGFPGAVAEIREKLGDLPLLMAGMIGSNRGWIEAPYVLCPAGIDELARKLGRPGDREAIVPGVSYLGDGRADVMRGEEIQLLGGVAAGLTPQDCLVCHPGTHNKWVVVSSGRIVSFRTVMTGELFNLIKEHSILSDLLQRPVEIGDAFTDGVRTGLRSDGIQADLFAVRARVLLGEARAEDAAPFASGLLIGADVAIGLRDLPGQNIVVMGRPELTKLYAAAIREAGQDAIELDGERCFLAGIGKLAERV